MENHLDHILVFRTSIKSKADCEKIRAGLDGLHAVENWSVDLEDIDCVLRVVSRQLSPQQVISFINNHGYDCAELE
jgi:hypothetical protein